MSLWGFLKLAPHVYLFISNYIPLEECQDILFHLQACAVCKGHLTDALFPAAEASIKLGRGKERTAEFKEIKIQKIKANLRIGPHNKDILSILFGSLLGDAHAEFRLKGTRITFYQEGSHVSYLIWLHKLISEFGYCNTNLPYITTRLGKKGVVRKIIRFKTWTYSSFNWIHELFYKDGCGACGAKKKGVPYNIAEYLTPLALAIWIMDDGSKICQGPLLALCSGVRRLALSNSLSKIGCIKLPEGGKSSCKHWLKLSTNSFSFSDCNFLVKVIYENFKLKSTVQPLPHSSLNGAGVENQYIIYIWKDSMPLLREIVLPYVHPSMKYKLINK